MASKKPENLVVKLIEEISLYTKNPENFLSVQSNVAKKLKDSTKKLYDLGKREKWTEGATGGASSALPELIIDHFDDEQIWQELELQNDSLVADLVSNVAQAVAAKDNISFDVKGTDVGTEDTNDVKDSDDDSESEDGEDSIDEEDDSGSEEHADDLEGDDLEGSANSDSDMELDRILKEDEKQRFLEDEEVMDSDSEIGFNFDLDKTDPEMPKSSSKSKKSETTNNSTKMKRKTVVDDQFFKLADMETFLEQEDAKEEKSRSKDKEDDDGESDSEVDMFKDFSSGDENEMDMDDVNYGAFFDPPDENSSTQQTHKKKVSFQESSDQEDESEEEEDDEELQSERPKHNLLSDSEGEDVQDILGSKKETKSTFEKRQERLKVRIDEIEDCALSEKPWRLAGEVGASARPENSLLEEHLNFDHMTRLAPVITEETTKTLEDLIKQRIKDKAFDDVERKIKPKDEPYEYKKRITLDQEKSKLSLGEVYEQEYLKQTQKEEEEVSNAEHEDIKKMMTSLFVKLDALSNFHFTPKPAAPEVQIISNLPSINMEEVAPVSTSQAALLAPEEIMEKQKGELTGATEKSETDRKRERREKKRLKRIKQREIEKKQELLEKRSAGRGNKLAKKQAMEKLEKQSKSSKAVTVIKDKENRSKSDIKSSASFFTKLQEEVTTQISSKKASQKKDKDRKDKSAAKFKL